MGAFGKMVASWLKSAAKQAAAADRIPRYVRVIYREMGDMRPVVAGRSKLYVFRWPFRVEPTWGGWVRVPGLDGDSTGVVVEPGAASDYPGEIRQVKALLPDLPVLPIYRSAPSHDVYHLPPIAAGLRPYPAWGNPVSELEVEFEHLHRGEIQAIFTERLGHVREPESLRGEQALLVPVRDSPYPAVVIDGLWVGNVLDDRVLSLLPHIQSLLRQGAALQVEARLWGLADNGVFRSRITLRLTAPEAIQPPGPFPAGACLLLPVQMWRQLGGFDDAYFMFFEDVDLGARVARAGRTNLQVPAAVVVHEQGASWKARPERMIRAHHASARRYLAGVYAAPWQAPLRWGISAGLRVREEIEVRSWRRLARSHGPRHDPRVVIRAR